MARLPEDGRNFLWPRSRPAGPDHSLPPSPGPWPLSQPQALVGALKLGGHSAGLGSRAVNTELEGA